MVTQIGTNEDLIIFYREKDGSPNLANMQGIYIKCFLEIKDCKLPFGKLNLSTIENMQKRLNAIKMFPDLVEGISLFDIELMEKYLWIFKMCFNEGDRYIRYTYRKAKTHGSSNFDLKEVKQNHYSPKRKNVQNTSNYQMGKNNRFRRV